MDRKEFNCFTGRFKTLIAVSVFFSFLLYTFTLRKEKEYNKNNKMDPIEEEYPDPVANLDYESDDTLPPNEEFYAHDPNPDYDVDHLVPDLENYDVLQINARENIWTRDIVQKFMRHKGFASFEEAIESIIYWPILGPLNENGAQAQLTKERLRHLIMQAQEVADYYSGDPVVR